MFVLSGQDFVRKLQMACFPQAGRASRITMWCHVGVVPNTLPSGLFPATHCAALPETALHCQMMAGRQAHLFLSHLMACVSKLSNMLAVLLDRVEGSTQ